MAGRQRTTFAKLQKERARQEKQAAKRARRQGLAPEPVIEDAPPVDINDPSTWRYADEIEASKDVAPTDEIEASKDAAPTNETASGT
ncbi:MAG: hypothetical protein MUP97_10325 [Acidimicrobiia bacterium]|jgi:hypothetical protein|nr:hypothetical protein [Acidimicrobiia bacterium]